MNVSLSNSPIHRNLFCEVWSPLSILSSIFFLRKSHIEEMRKKENTLEYSLRAHLSATYNASRARAGTGAAWPLLPAHSTTWSRARPRVQPARQTLFSLLYLTGSTRHCRRHLATELAPSLCFLPNQTAPKEDAQGPPTCSRVATDQVPCLPLTNRATFPQ